MDSNERPRPRITGAANDPTSIDLNAISSTPDGAYGGARLYADRTTTSEDAYHVKGSHVISGSHDGRSSLRMNTGKNSMAHQSAIASSVNYYQTDGNRKRQE